MNKIYILILVVALPLKALGQATTKIIINHETGVIRLDTMRNSVLKGNTIKLSTDDFKIIVENTNTFLYSYDLSSESTVPKDAENLTTFLTAFGPYLLDITSLALPKVVSGVPSAIGFNVGTPSSVIFESVLPDDVDSNNKNELIEELKNLSIVIDTLNKHLYGPKTSLKQYSSNFYSKMAKVDFPIKGDEISDFTKDALILVNNLSEDYDSLRTHAFSFSSILNTIKINHIIDGDVLKALAPYEKIYSETMKALGESEAVFAAVTELRLLVSRSEENDTTWVYAQTLSVSSQKGKTITLKIKPVSHKLLAVYAEHPAKEYTLEVTKKLKLKPTLGLSLFVAPNSIFPEYGTKETEDGKFEIIESTMVDNRVDYGLTLGLKFMEYLSEKISFPFLREKTLVKDLQLEFLLNPADKIRSFGLGIGYSGDILQVGGGFHWTRHQELLNGQKRGDPLDSKDDLLSEATYDFNKPKFYISVSFKGWAPFINK